MAWTGLQKRLDTRATDGNQARQSDFHFEHVCGIFDDRVGRTRYHALRADPSWIATQRPRADRKPRRRGLDVNIPPLVTETEPSRAEPRGEWRRQRMARIDNMGNYRADTAITNLRQASDNAVKAGTGVTPAIDLPVDAMQPIVLERHKLLTIGSRPPSPRNHQGR